MLFQRDSLEEPWENKQVTLYAVDMHTHASVKDEKTYLKIYVHINYSCPCIQAERKTLLQG